MKITITKTETGFDVALPFELKDSFKKAIPSAKWNATKKVWQIGVRSGKKAQVWADEAQSVADVIAEVAEREATQAEFDEALLELEAIKKEYQAVLSRHEKLSDILVNINSTKEKIKKVAQNLQDEKDALAKKTEKIKEQLSQIIDLNAIHGAKTTMAKLQGKMTSANRREFEQAQALVNKEREKLKQAGLGSHGLDDLWYVNWNRPDRDLVSRCRSVIDVYQMQDDEG